VLFRLPGAGTSWDAEEICLSGDVLFAGSIGRTDLPGGSTETMLASLRDKVLPLADDTVVLPGHGPATTIGRERVSNPYLRELTGAPVRGL
jgi:glyoxylase-like metal-dependent hydrolase (beta-lactamase superfamily II)